jgi:hypothetical protein
MYTFKEDAYFMIDRTHVQFKDCEFLLLKQTPTVISIELTRHGINQLVQNIKARKHKFGSDEYLIDFIVDELEGELHFYRDIDEDGNVSNDGDIDEYLQVVLAIKGGEHAQRI